MKTDPVLRETIAAMAADFNATEIRRQLALDAFARSVGVPSLRTVQSIVSETRRSGRTTAPAWNVTDADPETARLVCEVLAETSTGHAPVTAPHAERIAWLRRGWPDMPAQEAFDVARLLAADPALSERVLPYLTYTPWRDGGERYIHAYRRRHFRLFLTAASRPAFDGSTNEKAGDQPEGQPPAD